MPSHSVRVASDRSRWRVALLNGDGTDHGPITRTLERVGGIVSRAAPGGTESPIFQPVPAPDVVVVTGAADGDNAIVTAASVSKHYPVVLVARRIEPRLIERAGDAGIMACLLLPLRSDQVGPTFDLAIARFRELRDLRQALADRKAIERAKGRLMARLGLTEERRTVASAGWRWIAGSALESSRAICSSSQLETETRLWWTGRGRSQRFRAAGT
jgi:two-component system, response regulator PdtaR